MGILLDDTFRYLAKNDFQKLLATPLTLERVGATLQVPRMRAMKSQ